jgi:hypothetical protein
MAFSNPSTAQNITISGAQYGQYSSVFQFTVNLNKSPGQVVLIDPEQDGVSLSQKPIFKWRVPEDPENTPLHFQIEIDSSDSFNSRNDGSAEYTADSLASYDNFDFTSPRPSGVGQASYAIPVELPLRKVYYWRVRAYDGSLNDPAGYIARYGAWSEVRKLAIGIIATRVQLSASRTYLPVQGQTSDVAAKFVDKLGNVDTTIAGQVTFFSTESPIGTLSPRVVDVVAGVGGTVFTSAGAEGATHITLPNIVIGGVTKQYPYNDLTISSVIVGEIPILLYPQNGSRLASQAKPTFEWMVPANPSGDKLHFKIEIFKSPVFNSSNLIYTKESRVDDVGFKSENENSPDLPVLPLSSNCVYEIQSTLPDGKYWWRITPWDTGTNRYKSPSTAFVFSMPNEMTIVSKPLNSSKPITQAVVVVNVTLDIGHESVPGTVEHYITNTANEPELEPGETSNPNKIKWINITEAVKNKSKIVFQNTSTPPHGWAIAVKTIIKANESTGRISFNGHGVVFDGDYQELVTEDYIGVLSAITPIGFQAIPSADGSSIGLTWAYVDLNTQHKRIIDKFIVEVYNPATGKYEPYDGVNGEIMA